ncbi:MAG: YeeE/YedE family protein [Desulfobacterales bacterium]|nr:YeeE/YedE family protein [Desulfobacterales bacterium]
MKKNNYWSPYLAGGAIGLTLLVTFCIMGWGLGASSAFARLGAVGLKTVSPDYAGSLKYLGRYLQTAAPLKDWLLFEVGGILLGGLTAALLSGSFKFRFDKGRRIDNKTRLLAGFGGGLLIGFASRLARGCTSGVALAGGAQLAVAGFVFVIAMFASGFVTAAIYRRLW